MSLKFFPVQIIRMWLKLMISHYNRKATINPTVRHRKKSFFQLLNGDSPFTLDHDQGQSSLQEYSPVVIPIEDDDDGYNYDYDLDS